MVRWWVDNRQNNNCLSRSFTPRHEQAKTRHAPSWYFTKKGVKFGFLHPTQNGAYLQEYPFVWIRAFGHAFGERQQERIVSSLTNQISLLSTLCMQRRDWGYGPNIGKTVLSVNYTIPQKASAQTWLGLSEVAPAVLGSWLALVLSVSCSVPASLLNVVRQGCVRMLSGRVSHSLAWGVPLAGRVPSGALCSMLVRCPWILAAGRLCLWGVWMSAFLYIYRGGWGWVFWVLSWLVWCVLLVLSSWGVVLSFHVLFLVGWGMFFSVLLCPRLLCCQWGVGMHVYSIVWLDVVCWWLCWWSGGI